MRNHETDVAVAAKPQVDARALYDANLKRLHLLPNACHCYVSFYSHASKKDPTLTNSRIHFAAYSAMTRPRNYEHCPFHYMFDSAVYDLTMSEADFARLNINLISSYRGIQSINFRPHHMSADLEMCSANISHSSFFKPSAIFY
ncbi:unnamed protein product [Clavelina lepadiformis]|uniref:Uncharacterized protein n=1 Tax=Clavelina lepadiformis TaxID=159417 RepID=A0ABP0FC88_CLALP